MNKEELIGKLQMVYVGDKNALNELIGYYDGLKQGIEELQQENQKYKEVFDKVNKYLHTRAIKKCYNGKVYCGFDGLQAQVFEDILKGVDIMPTYYDEEYHYWTQTLDMNEIEYLKIEPMKEVE